VNGDTRDFWDVDTGGGTTKQQEIDIAHGPIRWKTRQPYLDRAVTPAATAVAASQLLNSGSANSPMGDVWNVSYQFDLQGQNLTHCPNDGTLIRARVFNPTAGSITLAAGRLRWMDLGDYVVCKASASLDFSSRANNVGQSLTITLPGVSLGDYVSWGTSAAYINEVVTAYVSAANTVTVRSHNASGGPSDPAANTFTVAKIREFGTYQNTLAYTPALINNATATQLTATLTGAQLGAHVFVSYSADLQGLICTAYVSSANTVQIVLTNYTGAGVTLAAGYFKIMAAF
jgi:hypothetical protein